MGAMEVMGTVMGPLTLSVEQLCATISLNVKYPTGKSEEIRLGRLDEVFGEPSNHNVQ